MNVKHNICLQSMSIHSYLEQVRRQLSVYFDVFNRSDICRYPGFMAIHKRREEQYVLSRSFLIGHTDNRLIFFVLPVEGEMVTLDTMERFRQDVQAYTKSLPQHADHMSTTVLGVIVTDKQVPDTVQKQCRRYRKCYFYKYGLHGWADIYMAVVELPQPADKPEVHVHAKAAHFMQPFVVKEGVNRK